MMRLLTIAMISVACAAATAKDSLPPLVDGKVPQNLDELWGDYDPTTEPLEAQVVREWEEDGIVLRYITYTIGTFKGQKSTMSAFYAFPKGEKNLPAMMEIHGGGGKANLGAAKWGAWNGYATLSVNWGGLVPLDDLNDTEPNTDWGALDATQQHNCHYNSLAPDHLTLDDVESPRNNNWFLLTLGCRRGITFLERQAEVDPKRIGVTGHSMGGKLTVDVAGIDKRVAVAVPSCGGTGSARDILSGMPGAGTGREESQLLLDTIDDVPYLKRLKCPTMFISPANDFAGPMDNMYINQRYVKNSFFQYAITPHRNHQHDEAFSVNTLLTFEQFLKKGFAYPQAPELTANLKTEDGIPEVTLVADGSKRIEKVDIYYSVDPHVLTRFWRDAEAEKVGDTWVAKAPIMSTSHPLFFYANVTYQEDLSKFVKARTRESYKNQFALSSNLIRLTSDELKAAGVKATDRPDRVVEDFSRGWHDWHESWMDNSHHWTAATRKLKDPKYRPPRGAKLLLDVKTEEDNTLVYEFRCNTWGAYPHRPEGTFIAVKEIKGSPEWQTIEVSESDLSLGALPRRKTDPLPKPQWTYVTEFSLKCKGSVIRNGESIDISRPWRGGREFRNLRWVGGRYPDKIIVSGGAVDISVDDLNSEIAAAIDASWEGAEDFFGEPDALGRIYLTPSMAVEIDTYLQVGENTGIDGKAKVNVGGKTYERGLGVHAESKMVFPLDGKFSEFHVVPGPNGARAGQVEMKILVDGKETFASGLVSGSSPALEPLTIPVVGARELTLVVTDGGNGKGGDHAAWADAYLTKEAASSPPPQVISQKDYSYAYWKNGWRKSEDDTSPNILCFEGGYYGFMLDVARLAEPRFGRFDDDSNVRTCLEAGTRRMDTLPEADLDISLDLNGNRYSLESCLAGESGNLSFVRMLEAGQVAQHFDIQHLVFKDAEGNRLGCYGDLDMVAWPNSLTFNLKLMPDFLYEDGPSEGVVGSGRCIIEKPLDIPHRDEIDPEELTVECWMKVPKTIHATGNWLLCKNTHNWQDGNFSFRHWGRSISAELNIGGGPENKHSLNLGHHRRNEWNHLALTYDGRDMKVYLNGNLARSKTIGKKRTPGRGHLRIGKRADGQSGILKGLYDQVRIWNRPLSGAEIKAHAQNPGVIPSREGLVLDENFDAGTVEKPDWQNAAVRLSFKGDGQAWQVEQQVPGAWKILEEKSFTLNCDLAPAKTDVVSIKVTTPDNQSFPVTFDKQMNCFMSTVKGLKRSKDFGQNGGRKYDDFLLEVTSSGSKRDAVPFLLNFRDGFGITGNVPILCDENGVPTGIHVQLSKNWHYGAYKLPYVMLPADPGTTRYILRIIYGYYGTLPSASHAQLSLIGYGGNGRWDQLAIGGWGETICFDIGMSLTDRAVTDIRGLMFRNGVEGTKWGWTDAGHGADWLGVRDSSDRKLLFNDLKTAYLAHGPCLSDVRYDGYYGAERQVDLKAQIQTLRTDDTMRTFQNLEYGFLKPVTAAKSFLYHLSSRAITPKVVYGNRAGVIADIDVPATAKTGDMLADQLSLPGEGPWWIAFPGATLGQEAQGGATGCRALIVRSYEANFAGAEQQSPVISLIIEDKGEGKKGVACNLVAPKGVAEFKPGDRVRFEMELMTHPRIADDYYGDNQAFIKHLRENPRSWKTVYREATGNDLAVEVSGGTLLKNYPIIIQADSRPGTFPGHADGRGEGRDTVPSYGEESELGSRPGTFPGQAEAQGGTGHGPVLRRGSERLQTVTVDIKGGVGVVPIRFENLDSNDYALYEVKEGKEVLLDQSIHGNDYWQTDYDAASGRYSMTFNLPLDGKPTSKWLLKRKPALEQDKGSPRMTYRDVAYDIHERTKLNFWQADGEGPRPLVVLVHGGGWLTRDKSEVTDVTRYLAKGISVAAINYRYSSIAPLPAPVLDAARAVQFLRYKAAAWNIDKNRIVLTGDSAGGCSSVLIACMPDLAKPDSEDPVERESTRIQGAAGAGAQVSVDPKQLEAWVGQQYAHHGMIVRAVGEESEEEMLENYAKHEAVFKAFSAINHLSKDDPPVYLAYSADLTVPALSYGHAIHHGIFGVKFQEKSMAVGHNNVHLAIGKAYTSQYTSPSDFVTRTLLE